ncbi:MAG: hypothetical protein U0451_02180 [Candidatus Saccharimonadales bacterium]
MDDDSKQDPKMVKISDIQNADFSDDTEPKDDRLMELLKLAYTKKIYCRTVIVAIEKVVPFSAYEPKVSEDYIKYFKENYQAGRPPGMLVYQRDDGKFVMSDDYNAYFMYKQVGADKVICQVLDAENVPDDVIEASDPYYMELPSVEQIN